MERQFTATAYVVENQRILLIYHRKLSKWLPPGGHVDLNELPTEAAIREVFEETGYHVELISQENIWIERLNANSFHRPFMCMLEEIPARPGCPAHQHMDFIYLAKLKGGEASPNPNEIDGIGWFNMLEIESMVSDVEIFEETKQTLRLIIG
jgi:8-oxo-dGTP pyrophosphatase MutT (NUDIX family)